MCTLRSGTSRRIMTIRGLTCITDRTVPVCQPLGSITLVTLLFPRVTAVVIAVLLPEPGLVVVEERQPGDPLGALPEVQVGYEQPYGAAVLRSERLSFVLPGDPRLAVLQVLQRQVGGVAGGGG